MCPWIENCLSEVRSWMITNFLKLNNSKTEFIVFGVKQQLDKVDNIGDQNRQGYYTKCTISQKFRNAL